MQQAQVARRSKAVSGEQKPLTLSVIIPCYNEAEFIESVLERVIDVGIAMSA